tara:strand:- start:880 stop:1353 length:474 start_codon:yes stop_codon:yes gene_type:complete
MSYKIIDNFLDNSHFEKIQKVFLSDNIPWYISEVNSYDTNIYFVHHIHTGHTVVSDHLNTILPIINKINPRALLRIKTNLHTRSDNLITHAPHTDYEYEHKAAIFYVNTNDGFTVLNDGTKIESVANRLLMFEAHKPHQSTNCTDENVRVNINFNYF